MVTPNSILTDSGRGKFPLYFSYISCFVGSLSYCFIKLSKACCIAVSVHFLGLIFASFLPSTFIPMIIGEIRRYLRDNNPIRVSRSIRDTAYRALSVKERITAATGQEPGIEEIAKELDVSKEDIATALDAILDPLSLQEPVYHDGTDAVFVMDQVKDEKNIDDSWLEKISLKEAMKKLGQRERHILNLRFFEGKTQMEVAKEIGISQAQVSRLEKNALGHMRKYL